MPEDNVTRLFYEKLEAAEGPDHPWIRRRRELRRAERERCARLADACAEYARYEFAGEQQTAAADMARRIARTIRLMED